MAMPLERLSSHPAGPRPEHATRPANDVERPKRKRVSFGEIADNALRKFAGTEAAASRYLSELAKALEHFDAKTALLPDGTPFERLGWGETQAQDMLDAAFSHYERLSKERRLAEQRLGEEDTVRAPIPAVLRTRPVERPATRIQELENRKIVIETNLRELRSEIPGAAPSLWDRAKTWWRQNIAKTEDAKEAAQKTAAFETELREIQREIEMERKSLQDELRPTFIQTPRQVLRNLGQDAASLVGGIPDSRDVESQLAEARARGDAPSEWEMQARQDEWDAWQSDRKEAKRAHSFRGADEIEASRGAWREFQADAAARRRERPIRPSPEEAKAAEAEWDRMLAETETEKRNAPKRTVDRATIDANPAIFKTKGRIAKETANDILAGIGIGDFTANKERVAARKKEERAPLLDEAEWTDADAFEADLDRSSLAERVSPIDIEKLRGPALLKLPEAEVDSIERVLRSEGLDPAKEWQRVNKKASAQLVDDIAAYNVANAYIRNLALASSGPGKARTVAERNLERLERLLAEAKRPEYAARRTSRPRPPSTLTRPSDRIAP